MAGGEASGAASAVLTSSVAAFRPRPERRRRPRGFERGAFSAGISSPWADASPLPPGSAGAAGGEASGGGAVFTSSVAAFRPRPERRRRDVLLAFAGCWPASLVATVASGSSRACATCGVVRDASPATEPSAASATASEGAAARAAARAAALLWRRPPRRPRARLGRSLTSSCPAAPSTGGSPPVGDGAPA